MEPSGISPSSQAPIDRGTASISDHDILVRDRIKFHLGMRTSKPVAFVILDTTKDRNQHQQSAFRVLDHDLLDTSYAHVRHTAKYSAKPIHVPQYTTAETVNAFCQIVSPERATQLPTHYLWPSIESIPGVYDRFGAIRAEKIHSSIDMLLELLAFARYMEVFWISDTVIDRIHWMYIKQLKNAPLLHIPQTESCSYHSCPT